MRGDCIGALGHPDISTPNLDTLCNHGVSFPRAYSATPTCVPARAALFTGLSQERHCRVGYQDYVPWDYATTLPGELTAAGYHTHCAGKMHVWPARSLLGFHSVDLHDSFLPYRNTATPAREWWDRVDDYTRWLRQTLGREAEINDPGIGCNSWAVHPWPLPDYTHPTNWTAERSLDFLRRRDPTKPFFLWTSFVAPHPPYYPPQPYLESYQNRELAMPVVGEWAKEIGRPHPDGDCFEGQLRPHEIHRMLAGYYGLITHLDHQIGRILRALKDEGLLQSTVILFTADHGEMLGDHHMFRKSQPFQGSVSVPFLLYDPGGQLGLPEGSRCDAIAELRDVMPTLLESADIPVPPSLDGASLLDAARGGPPPRTVLHGEHASQQTPGEGMHYLVNQRYKYIWYTDGREMLFDLREDPREMVDLAEDSQWRGCLEEMRTRLAVCLAGREEGYSDGRTLIPGRKARTLLSKPHYSFEEIE